MTNRIDFLSKLMVDTPTTALLSYAAYLKALKEQLSKNLERLDIPAQLEKDLTVGLHSLDKLKKDVPITLVDDEAIVLKSALKFTYSNSLMELQDMHERGIPDEMTQTRRQELEDIKDILSKLHKVTDREPYRPPWVKNGPLKTPSKQNNFRKTTDQKIDIPSWITPKLSKILKSNYEEILICLQNKCWKSAVILSGGCIEAILRSSLKKKPNIMTIKSAKIRKGKVCPIEEWGLYHLINAAEELGIVRQGLPNFLHGVRDYRNLVHPDKEADENYSVTKPLADAAFGILNAVVEDINKRPRRIPSKAL